MMKKLLAMWLSFAFITACSVNQVDGNYGMKEVCIKGVVYYQHGHRLAVAMMPSGKPYLCPGKG